VAMIKQEQTGTALAMVGLFIYGVEPVVIKANPSDPVSFAAFSVLIASIILWPVALVTGGLDEIQARMSPLGRAAVMGLFGTALAYLSYSFGAKMSTAANAALITRSEVLWSLLLSWLLLRERITKRLALYSAVILTGLVIVMTGGKKIEPHLGDLLLLLVPLFWQIGHVIAKSLPYSPPTIAALRNTFGFLFLAPFALHGGFQPSWPMFVEGIIIALGQLVWYGSIKRINLSKATAIITPAPAVAMGIGIFIGESLTIYHLIGFFLISVGTLGAVKVKSELRT
jgi:drug/metabolite transporter (DMT)-like permease